MGSGAVLSLSDSTADLRGEPVALLHATQNSSLTLGGEILKAVDSTVNVTGAGALVRLDDSLLEAVAPIIRLVNSTLTATPTVPQETGLIHLYQSTVTSLGPVAILDRSFITIQDVPLVFVGLGSTLTVNNDFLHVLNGSRLTVLNAPLIVANGGTLIVSGALVNFGGMGGNQVIVNNAIAPTAIQSGIPVNVGAGSSVTIGPNPIKNLGLGSVSITGSAIQATNGGKVTIAAP